MSNSKKYINQNDKAQRILTGVSIWAGYYRENPQIFVKEYLNIVLKLFLGVLGIYEISLILFTLNSNICF